ncbi:MAG: response regulator [Euryarchaeota archaeon]|nr:response regulator [Euryarchaeota archaeon]MDE1835114.1 response regulator [Euryarchaeota archaeon]MDE1880700.1 response regulator [Euryarchaeota archaeon]MDE2044923.1 response regulator [Thermoplasmata archaeon]
MSTADPPKTPSGTSLAPPSRTPRSYRILVVDDDADMLLLIGSALRHATGFASEVYVANDPKTALSKAEGDPFDVVITDYQMPGMNGLELLKEFRKKHPHVLRVLITAHSTEGLALEAFRGSGVHTYLEKPFHPKTLVAVLQEVVYRRDPLRVGAGLGADGSDTGIQLLADLKKRLGEVPPGLAEITLTLTFDSPIDLNAVISEARDRELASDSEVRYAAGKFLVHLTLRNEDGSPPPPRQASELPVPSR